VDADKEPPLLAAEGTTNGGDEDGICGFQESGLKWGACRIPAESRETKYAVSPFRKANASMGQKLPSTKYLEK
jgi:hypothetical protein